MRKVIALVHTSLDGFLAGPGGEMDWIRFDDALWDYVAKATDISDTAIYGRVTFEMMESYWPTAGEKPGASKHDIEHSDWTNRCSKIVFSTTRKTSDWKGTVFIAGDMKGEIKKLKDQPGKNLLLIGSVSIIHAFTKLDLIDEYWINVNPVLLGKGQPLFNDLKDRVALQLLETRKFDCGVAGLRYEVKRNAG